jgi:hypothetical protein
VIGIGGPLKDDRWQIRFLPDRKGSGRCRALAGIGDRSGDL